MIRKLLQSYWPLALLVFIFPLGLQGQSLPTFRSGLIAFSNCSAPNAKSPVLEVCAKDPAAPGSMVTFFELLRHIYPDLRPDGSASTAPRAPRKSLGQMDLSSGEAPQNSAAAGAKQFLPAGSFSYLSVDDSQGTKVAILESQSGLLAYFQVLPAVKLLDYVGIAQDTQVSLAPDLGVNAARPGELLFWTSNSHYNAGESFNIYNLFHAGTQGIDLVYDGPMLYSFSLPNTDCALVQSLAPVKVLSRDADGFPVLAMSVRQEKRCQKGEKEVVLGPRGFKATLRWDKTKYMGGSKELFRLNRCRTEGRSDCGS